MAKFYLKYEQSILAEYPLDTKTVTIGRRPDNTIHIDHLSVSASHARVECENGEYVIYDHESTNGTYVNGQPVARKTILHDGDTIHIARHILSFVEDAPAKTEGGQKTPEVFGNIADAAKAPVGPPKPGDSTQTIKLTGEPVDGPAASPDKGAFRPAKIVVADGKTDQKEYVLTGNLNVIGKAEMATIRLMRWFAPKVAANIHMRDGKFYLSAAEGEEPVVVNGEVQKSERQLAEGDTFLVDGVTMKFSYD